MKRPPRYPAKPHASGQARMKWRDKSIYLGVWGSPESYTEYQRLVEQWRTGQDVQPATHGRRIIDVANAFLVAAESGERPTSAKELGQYEDAIAMLGKAGVAEQPAPAFDAGRLEVVLRRMLQDWARPHACRQISRLRTVWRWAERKGMVPHGSWANLLTLKLGTGQAREEVEPVPREDFDRTLPHLGRIPRAMAELQLLTGARPSEILELTVGQIRKSGEITLAKGVRLRLGKVWAAELPKHKNAWRGHRRFLLFAEPAQRLLESFLSQPKDSPLFSPKAAALDNLASIRRKDGLPVRKRLGRKRPPGAAYRYHSYLHAITRACKRGGIEPWSPNRIRHLAGTVLTEQFGAEVARLVLGQRDLATTRIYVQDRLDKALAALEKAG